MFVPVMDNWSCFKIKNKSLYFRCKTTEGKFAIGSTQIPYLDWELLGDSKQLIEDDLVGVMPRSKGWLDRFYDFKNDRLIKWTALEAFNSLKESLQLSKGKYIVLFEAKK